jgi:kynurenine formamidase
MIQKMVLLSFFAATCAVAAAIDDAKVVDLTYPFDAKTIYWPTAERFTLKQVARGKTAGGYFYAANNICLAEHGGTHIDAPIHFAEGKASVEQLPVTAGIGPLVVVDAREKASADRDYRLQVADLTAWETAHGRIPAGAIVVMFSGWGKFWGDALQYLGTDKPGDTANLHFPGFSKEAAEFLARARDIKAIGVDTASVDFGPSTDFIVHRIVNGANKPAFENIANLDRVPAAGATLIALPMKIGGGSGGPTRIIALLP